MEQQRKTLFQRLIAAVVVSVLQLSLAACTKSPTETASLPDPDAQAVQQTMDQYDQIIMDVEPILAQYQDENGYVAPENQDEVLQQISKYAKELHEHGKITDYSYEPGDTCVYMRIDDWLTVIYDVPVQDMMGGGTSYPEIITLEPNATEFTASYLLSGMGGPVEAATMVTAAFPEIAYNYKARNEDVTVESFKQELHNSIIIFCGHGGYSAKLGPVLFTGIEAYDPATILLYTLEFGDEAIALNQNGKIYLTHVFFDKYVPDDAYAGSLIYLGACSSAQDEQLVRSFFDCGARAVIANNYTIQVAYNYRMICSFFAGLSHKTWEGRYRTVSEALEYARDLEGETSPITGAGVIGYCIEGDDFTLPELIDPVDHHLDINGTLSIYDKNGEYYSGYTVTIESISLRLPTADRQPNMDTQYSETIEVNTAGPYQLELPAGLFRFEISDAHNPDTYSFIVEAAPGFASNIDFITAYEEPLVVVIPGIDYENLVSDAAVETVLYDDDWCYCYHIPQFNLSGDHAQQINRKMVDHCDDLLDQYVYPSVRDYGYAEIEQLIYDWGYHRDLASVVLMSVNMWGGAEYDVYTISTSTGQEVAVDTLLAAYGLDLESFHELVRTRLQQYWDERSDWREDTGTEFFDDRVDRTLSDENIRSAVPYINSEGGLSFVANIYSLAGGDSYYHRINAKGPIEAASMQCTKDHRSNSSSKDDPLPYFIENCSSRYFEKEEIQSFDLQMCMYARNAIFARAGRKFQNEELRTYFEQYSWYQPHIEPENFQDSMLSAIELANVNLILEYEQTLKADSQIPSSIQTTEQALQAYGDVLDMFHAGISSGWKNRDSEGWGVPRDPDDVSYLFYAYLSDYTLTQIGYAFLDLNGDGNLELLVAPMDLQDKGEFYELYTVAGGKLVHAVSAGERDRYYAAVDGSINNHGSGSALTSADDNLHLNPADGSLKVNQAVIYDAYRDRLNPYFYAETDYYDPKTYETDYSVLKSISEEEAKRIEDAFPDNRVITWVPFAQYADR